MQSININAIVSCSASFCRAQVIGSYCKKIYKGFSGNIITEWHRVAKYETVELLPVAEHTTVTIIPEPREVNESLWN